jgi:cytochrome oxidase assembly protein ShyY1
MPTNREKRLAKERQAASFVEKNNGQMVALLQDVTQEIGAELVGLSQIQRDSRLAAEMAYRLDNAIEIPNELVEALDWFGFYLGSLIVIAIYRCIERGMKRKKEKASKLRKKLEDNGPRMAKAARRRIERRIARLERVK